MDILIQADGVTLTEAIKAAIDEKISRVEQYAPRAVRARAVAQSQRPSLTASVHRAGAG